MTQNFTVEIKDEEKHRIIIPPATWKLLGLKKGDFIKVTIEKAEK